MPDAPMGCVEKPADGAPVPHKTVKRTRIRKGDPTRGFAVGRHVTSSDQGDDDEGELIEDYEDPTRARRPSDHGATIYDDRSVQRLVDAVIVKLRKTKVPFRTIGKILNRDHSGIVRRYADIPERVRKHYESMRMG